ncbi:MAG: FG-GAP-like repeat-containing protein [Blastocatellia bacterium]|nr:FG-GAP-like repeat-containing protein [Blastocatellia bacterium]
MKAPIVYSSRIAFTAFAVFLALSTLACRSCEDKPSGLPDPSSALYRDAVSAFYTGLAALEIGDDARAEEKLNRMTELVPQEPAGWANLGLLLLRHREFDQAVEKFERARSLAPENSGVYLLLGLLEINRGRQAEAVSHLRRAIDLDPKNIKAGYALAQEIENQNGESGATEAQRLVEKTLEAQPDNLAAMLELARLAAKRGDSTTLQNTVARIAESAPSWPPEAQEQFNILRAAAEQNDTNQAAGRVAFLRNVLVRVPQFRQSLAAIKTPPEKIADPFTRFVFMASPDPLPAPPDTDLRFAPEPISIDGASRWEWAGSLLLSGEALPLAIVADGRRVRVGKATLDFPGGPSAMPPSADAVAALDFDYDFKIDLALAGAGGLRLFRQEGPDSFSDVTARTGLPSSITNAAYAGVWAVDMEADGDLDIIAAASEGQPLALRNNGDGSFVAVQPFAEASSLRSFAWADLDGDGDADAALLDAQGRLQIYANERQGLFRERPSPQNLGRILAISVMDVDRDGRLDLVALEADGRVSGISYREESADWTVAEIARWPEVSNKATSETFRLFAADLDNNGGVDLIASGSTEGQVFLSGEQGKFQLLAGSPFIFARIFAVADLAGDGLLDLVGLSDAGRPVQAVNRSRKDYKWKEIRARAGQATGDQRINSYGIGGEMEIRSGLLVQKLPIARPLVHFGLGKYGEADVVRIIWPNGSVQAEFDLKSDIPGSAPAVFDQRLDGSCPFIFTYDGKGMQFVTDFIWRSPLGLRINAQDTAGVMQTEDWVKIRGDQLVAKDGFYDVRITGELWETHFFDHVSLMVVDHPAGTDIFVDERFVVPPPALAVHTMKPPVPVRAWDDNGQEVTDIIKARDGVHLNTFGRGQYQGVTRDHYVEVEIPAEAPAKSGNGRGPLWLVAHGWVHPTDSSINVALGQGSQAPPQGLSLEVADGRGGWMVAKAGLGFPSGKNKTVLINLDNVFKEDAPRRLRLRTNLEVYWDAIAWAEGLPNVKIETTRVRTLAADLRYRGFSVIRAKDRSSPELPEYDRLEGTAQRWRDLVGYHTRFGDITELLEKIDDRYVIMNAGDEMAFRFEAPPPPREGWVRDFVLIGDGWVKDGDFNTAFSTTVLPLPSHSQRDYTKPPGRLEDDPVYRRHSRDWQTYHTRYVTPDRFQNALRPKRRERNQ